MDYASASSAGSDLDSEVEVFPFEDSESEDVNVPEDENHRAWGNKKNLFYDGNDLSDGSDSDSDDNLEQEEINLAETRLSGVLKETDYEPNWLEVNELQTTKPVVASGDKIAAVKKVLNSFQRCIAWLQKYSKHSVTKGVLTPEGNVYIQSKMHLIFCYCVNVLYYLQLKVDSNNASNHPVVERMVLLNKLISKVRKGDDQLGTALDLFNSNFTRKEGSKSDAACMETSGTAVLQDYKQVEEKGTPTSQFSTSANKFLGLVGKRAITYQIARNKGLMPKRKKEQRNPRVKHRRKYSKALIKRRSQVLPVVHEQCKYGGETSGIRSQLARSVIIK